MNISEINIYPIKSLKGISLSSAVVEERGLRHDRRWMLTDKDGMFFTQREFPKMATITTELTSDGLRVTSENADEMAIPFEPDKGLHGRVTVWDSICDAEIYVGEVSEWFSDVIGTNCRLVYMPEASHRGINKKFKNGGEIVSFADGYPLLVIGEASLRDLNDRIFAQNARRDEEEMLPLPMNRFRPNIVVAGSQPYEEDYWDRVRIGEAVFRGTKPCARCVMTTIDQAKGVFDGKDPLKTLASYRMAKDAMPNRFESLGLNPTAVLFGQNLVGETPGATINLGDKVIPQA